jgi:hypothetical protein
MSILGCLGRVKACPTYSIIIGFSVRLSNSFFGHLEIEVGSRFLRNPAQGPQPPLTPGPARLQKVELTIFRCSKECIAQWTITLGLLQNLRSFVLISIRATEGLSTKTEPPYLHLPRQEYGLLLSEYALYSLLLDCLLVNPPSLPPFMIRPHFIPSTTSTHPDQHHLRFHSVLSMVQEM